MHARRIRFENAHGQRLAALLNLPLDDHPVAYALFAHCFTCSKDYKAVSAISRALAAEGIAVLRFDFTGLGESEGDFADTNFSSNVDDLVAAADFMSETMEGPAILIGHSLGGAAVLKAAARVATARAVVTIAAPSSPRHVLRAIDARRDEIERHGEAEVTIAGRTFHIKKQFLDDLAEDSMRDSVADLRKALLILHSPIDNVVGIDNATEIFVAARHPKSFVSLDRADHLLSDPNDARYAASVIASWAQKYVGVRQGESEQRDPGDNCVIARTGATGYRTEVLANGQACVADEPVSLGGTDTGPSPYELLAAALGACTTMTLRMYADRKEWPLQGVEARLEHSKIHCEDCANPDSPRSRIDHFLREITVDGPLDEDQRRRLLEIADRCPVHRTLHSDVKVTTTLSGATDTVDSRRQPSPRA
jgi:putative redox protein